MLNETKKNISINKYVTNLNEQINLHLKSPVFAGTDISKKILNI